MHQLTDHIILLIVEDVSGDVYQIPEEEVIARARRVENRNYDRDGMIKGAAANAAEVSETIAIWRAGQ